MPGGFSCFCFFKSVFQEVLHEQANVTTYCSRQTVVPKDQRQEVLAKLVKISSAMREYRPQMAKVQ
jgi:hypothetical protein